MNATEHITFGHAAAMPAATWHFLKMNDAVIEVPEGLAVASVVQVRGVARVAATSDAFERALRAAQVQWEASHPAPTPEERAERAAYLAAEADATYGGTAQSAYQARADAVEDARSLVAAFKHGMGDDTAAYLRQVAGKRIVVEANAGATADAQVVVSAIPGAIDVAAIDVVAGRGSQVRLSLLVDSPDPDPDTAPGFAGTTLRVFADAEAQVDIVRTQTLADGFTDIDDMGLFAHDRTRIAVRQTVLGATATFTGLAGDLRGDSARVDVQTRYLGCGGQEHDFNYALRHHGTRTRCNLEANGVLAGNSKKTLRGTIDLVRGCKGAEGSERETVLLIDDGVRNKTVPVILCNEDDVAGNHGATIGHIRAEQLFYLATRGLSQETAEAMFMGAMVEQAALDAPDADARDAVIRYGERLSPGFADLFDEEVDDE